VDRYNLTNRNGLVAKITNLGGHLTDLHVPDRDGQLADIVLGHSTLEPYLDHKTNPYFGSIVGRYANRITKASSPSTASSTRSTPGAALGVIQLELLPISRRRAADFQQLQCAGDPLVQRRGDTSEHRRRRLPVDPAHRTAAAAVSPYAGVAHQLHRSRARGRQRAPARWRRSAAGYGGHVSSGR
jgi:aldose 1-epimerase